MAPALPPAESYRLLRERYGHMVTGAPDTPAFRQIVELLFTPEEADIARRIPAKPVSLDTLVKRLNRPKAELRDRLGALAEKGLLLDFERGGRRYYMLPPVIIGFFEFVFMRARDGMPMAQLAALFEEYMHDPGGLATTVFEKQTQLSRSLMHEEALPQGDFTEVLDWERASRIIETASAVGVALCACRHKASLLGNACDAPMTNCLTLNDGVHALAAHGTTRVITKAEGLKLLEEAKAAGLAQTADNVKSKVGYICNCCGCCCGEMQAVRRFDLPHAIVSSNWVAHVNTDACRACGRCIKACPVSVIEWRERLTAERPPVKWAEPDADRCLGCGVCHSACKHGAILMRPREQRVFTPENTYERVLLMAIERGKLADLIFDPPETLSHRVLLKVSRALEKSPPMKAAMAVKPLRSAFFNALVRRMK